MRPARPGGYVCRKGRGCFGDGAASYTAEQRTFYPWGPWTQGTYKDHPINPYITKQLEMVVKEIDGVRDPMTLSQTIQIMPIKDSQNIRKVVRENAPELDLNIKVKTPSNQEIGARIAFGVEFFRPFYGL